MEDAVIHDGVLYRTDCRTAAGPYPYSDEMRFGAMSVTKSAMLNIAMLRLAQKFGAEFLDEPIAKYFTAARRPGWDDVTYRQLANMSSGHHFKGEGGTFADLKFNCWVQQRTKNDRIEVALSSYPRTYQPGAEFHYINQDSYLEGTALDALLKSQEGCEASTWEMLKREVYQPIGIHHLPSASTIEEDGSQGLPLWSAGYYPTINDLAKLALLMKNRGAWGDQQILNRELVESLLPTTT
ncbi:class A beta-lactamase-related serine hydrolase, partial [Mesorhizobium sp. M2A.F.Ca.ET.037.01.1.1]